MVSSITTTADGKVAGGVKVDGRSAWLACGFGSWRWWGKDDDAPGGIPAVWWDAIGALPSSCIPSTTLGASMLLLQQISAWSTVPLFDFLLVILGARRDDGGDASADGQPDVAGSR